MAMTRTPKITILITAIVIAVVGVIWFTGDRGTAKETVTIGVILPLTGPTAIIGEWHRKAMEIAAGEVQDRWRNRDLKIVFEDSKNDPKEGLSAFNKLANVDKAAVVISAMSRVSLPLIPVTDAANIPLFLTDVTYPDVTAKSLWVFRYFLSSDSEARAMAAYAKQDLGVTNMALLYVNDEAGAGGATVLKTEFQRLGGKIVGEDTFEVTELDLRGRLLKIKQQEPQALWIYGFGKVFGVAVKQAREIGFKGVILTNQAMAIDEFRATAGEAAEGSFFTMPDLSLTKNGEFISKYRQRWNSEPGLEAFYGYDILRLIATALERENLRPERLRSQLLSIRDFEGSFGKVSVPENRDIPVPLALATIKGGSVHLVKNLPAK